MAELPHIWMISLIHQTDKAGCPLEYETTCQRCGQTQRIQPAPTEYCPGG
jgi:hypothetical protein